MKVLQCVKRLNTCKETNVIARVQQNSRYTVTHKRGLEREPSMQGKHPAPTVLSEKVCAGRLHEVKVYMYGAILSVTHCSCSSRLHAV